MIHTRVLVEAIGERWARRFEGERSKVRSTFQAVGGSPSPWNSSDLSDGEEVKRPSPAALLATSPAHCGER
jgi:hypothetical protein